MKLRTGRDPIKAAPSANEVLREGLLEDLRRDPARKDLDLLRAFWVEDAKPTGLRRVAMAERTSAHAPARPVFGDLLRAASRDGRAVAVKADFSMLDGERKVVARRERSFWAQAWQMVSLPVRYATHQVALAARRGDGASRRSSDLAGRHGVKADAYRVAAERIRRFGFFRDVFGVATFSGVMVARGLALRHEACSVLFVRLHSGSEPKEKLI